MYVAGLFSNAFSLAMGFISLVLFLLYYSGRDDDDDDDVAIVILLFNLIALLTVAIVTPCLVFQLLFTIMCCH